MSASITFRIHVITFRIPGTCIHIYITTKVEMVEDKYIKEADEQIMNPDLTKVQCLRGRAIAFLYLINHMHLLDENQNAGTGHALKIIFHVL